MIGKGQSLAPNNHNSARCKIDTHGLTVSGPGVMARGFSGAVGPTRAAHGRGERRLRMILVVVLL